VNSTPSPSIAEFAIPAATPRITMRGFRPEDAIAFRQLNEAWISKHFVIEESDRIALNDPLRHILEPGGHIFMAVAAEAVDAEEVVGCCALIPHGPGAFEVAKMAVAERRRGRGIGRQVLEYTVAQARLLGATLLYLESNSKLADAVHLYESIGFRHLSPEEISPSPYRRANVFMDLKL
jgi:putative acetyltransferase